MVQASALCPNCGNLKFAMMFVGLPNSAYGRHPMPTNLNNWVPRVGLARKRKDQSVPSDLRTIGIRQNFKTL
jgi:hypothetical protein